MKKKQIIAIRMIFLPLSLFALIVGLDQDKSYIVALSVFIIIGLISWWYLDEVNTATKRKVLTKTVLDIASKEQIKDPKLSVIPYNLKETLLLEKFYSFDTCKVLLHFRGVIDEVSFDYKEVECEGIKNFSGHVLTLYFKGAQSEKVSMYDSFPYSKTINKLTVVGLNENKIEVAVEDVMYLEDKLEVNIQDGLSALKNEIDYILQEKGVQK